MARPYRLLRVLMAEYGDTQATLARLFTCCRETVSYKFNGRSDWTLSEMYTLLDRYGVQHSDLHKVFPPGGKNEING